MRTYLALCLGLVFLSSCDPVKRSLKRQEKVDALIQEYLSRNPPQTDTVYLRGAVEYYHDTIVNENIYVDTVRAFDTVWVHQIKYRDLLKTVYSVDTVLYRVNNYSGVSSSQYMLLTDQLKAANKLKNTYLGALVILAALCLLAIAYRFFK